VLGPETRITSARVSAGTASSELADRGTFAAAASTRALRIDAPIAGLLAICATGAGLRFYGLGHQGFWFDEGNTALLVHQSLGRMIGLIPHTESTPPLYYCVAWLWARIFGFGEAGLRSLSAVAGVLTIPVAYGIAARLISRRAGLILSALCACSPLLIWYSQEARSYALLVLLCALALLAFATVLEDPTPRRVAAWVLCSVLALLTHYYAVVVLVPQAAWMLLRSPSRRSVQAGVMAVGLAGLALIPLVVSQNSTGRDSWIGHSPLGTRLAQIVPQMLIGTDAPARVVLKLSAMALAVVAVGLLVLAGRLREAPARSRGALLLGALALAGLLLSLIFIAAGSDTLITRNIIGLWLPAAGAMAGGLALARPAALGAIVAGLLCAIGVTAAVGVAANRDLQRPDWRLVAGVLGTRPAHGAERVLLIQHYRTLLPLSLYLPGLRFMAPSGGSAVTELDVVAMSSPQQPLCWWGAACNLIPSRMQDRYRVPGFHEVWVRRARRFTIMRLVSREPVQVTPAEVSRALTATSLARDELLVQRRPAQPSPGG